MRDIDWETVKEQGWQRLAVPERYAPFAEGGFPTPSGKPSSTAKRRRNWGSIRSCLHPPRPDVHSAPELARRYPLAFISPPCALLELELCEPAVCDQIREGTRLDIHPDDARARGIVNGDRVRVYDDRGSYMLKAAVSDRARPGGW